MKRSCSYAYLCVVVALGLIVGGLWGCTWTSKTEAVISVSSTHGTVPVTIVFDGSESLSPNGVTSYYWSFGDGEEAYTAGGEHTFNHAGQYEVRLTVWGAGGVSSSAVESIQVDPAFWITDDTLDKIHKLDTAGNVLMTLDSPVSRPQGVAMAVRRGTWMLYVACAGNGAPRIVTINLNTDEVSEFVSPAQNHAWLTYSSVSRTDYLWHLDRSTRSIYMIKESSGLVERYFTVSSFQASPHLEGAPFLRQPQGIAWSEGEGVAGSLWVLEGDTRLLYEVRIIPPPDDFSGPQLSLQPDPIELQEALFPIAGYDWYEGFLWVVDSKMRRVVQVDPQTGVPTGNALFCLNCAAVSGLFIQK